MSETHAWSFDLVAEMQRVWWWRELPDSAVEMYAEALSRFEEEIATSAVSKMREAIEQWPSLAAVLNFCRLAQREHEDFHVRHDRHLRSIGAADEGVPMPDDVKQRIRRLTGKGEG